MESFKLYWFQEKHLEDLKTDLFDEIFQSTESHTNQVVKNVSLQHQTKITQYGVTIHVGLWHSSVIG